MRKVVVLSIMLLLCFSAVNAQEEQRLTAEQVLAEMPATEPADEEDSTPAVVVSAAAAAAAEQLRNEAPPEEDDRPIHQRLFSNVEEPCVMPMPPEEETAAQETEEKTAVTEEKDGMTGDGNAEKEETAEDKTDNKPAEGSDEE